LENFHAALSKRLQILSLFQLKAVQYSSDLLLAAGPEWVSSNRASSSADDSSGSKLRAPCPIAVLAADDLQPRVAIAFSGDPEFRSRDRLGQVALSGC
jgi:hypothetical protein